MVADPLLEGTPKVRESRRSDPAALPVRCNFVREKRSWIYEKLAQKELLRRDVAAKQYVNGEGFPYLGRNYRLLLVSDQPVPVKLEHGRFKMLSSVAPQGRDQMVRWYQDHAAPWLADRVERFANRVTYSPAA